MQTGPAHQKGSHQNLWRASRAFFYSNSHPEWNRKRALALRRRSILRRSRQQFGRGRGSSTEKKKNPATAPQTGQTPQRQTRTSRVKCDWPNCNVVFDVYHDNFILPSPTHAKPGVKNSCVKELFTDDAKALQASFGNKMAAIPAIRVTQ
ncbi:ORF3 [Anelloviridae sp.]|nr:ORF3 [Anelloviridae sp.]